MHKSISEFALMSFPRALSAVERTLDEERLLIDQLDQRSQNKLKKAQNYGDSSPNGYDDCTSFCHTLCRCLRSIV